MSVPGSKRALVSRTSSAEVMFAAPKSKQTHLLQRGFTLLELLVVIAIIAIASGAVSLSLRDSGQTQLQREAEKLTAHLEAARARSRAAGTPIVWRADKVGYRFEPGDGALQPWLAESITLQASATLTLGPEPMIEAQEVVLALGKDTIRVATDGIRPFAVLPFDPEATQ